VINYAKSWFTVEFPEVWLFALGGLFVLSTMYFPKGLIGFISDKARLAKKKVSTNDTNSESEQIAKEAAV
jgi:urea transport system permease protein